MTEYFEMAQWCRRFQRNVTAGIVLSVLLLCVAMSDGPYFPYANFAALAGICLLVRQGRKVGVL